jgi:hypothetical protein
VKVLEARADWCEWHRSVTPKLVSCKFICKEQPYKLGDTCTEQFKHMLKDIWNFCGTAIFLFIYYSLSVRTPNSDPGC